MRGLKAKRLRQSIMYKQLKDQDPVKARKYYRILKKKLKERD